MALIIAHIDISDGNIVIFETNGIMESSLISDNDCLGRLSFHPMSLVETLDRRC